MELGIIFFMMSMVSSGIFHTASPAPASASVRHLRPRRCSCATFLDKECVYFCHLDIIWVNTPERAVSYGLGNAPRKKRSVREMSRAAELPRCECAHSTDVTCLSFCQTRNPRSETVASGCAGVKCRSEMPGYLNLVTLQHFNLAEYARNRERALPSFLRATSQLLLLLKT